MLVFLISKNETHDMQGDVFSCQNGSVFKLSFKIFSIIHVHYSCKEKIIRKIFVIKQMYKTRV